MTTTTSSSSKNSNSGVIIYDGNPILWSPFIARYHIDLTIRGLSYIMNDEEITSTLREPPPPVYQLPNNDGRPEDAISREKRITYNISIGQNYASAHKIWEEQCFKVYSDFETAVYILLERVSSQISSEVFKLLTTQQFSNSRERYNAVWSMIFKRFGPHNQSHIRSLLTKCDPYTEGWLVVLDKFDSAIKTLRNIPYCNSKTGLAIHDEDGKPITFEPTNEDLLGYLKRHLSKAPANTPLSRVLEKITKMANISFEEVAIDIRSIFAGSTPNIQEEPAKVVGNIQGSTATVTSNVNSSKPLPPATVIPTAIQQLVGASSSSVLATVTTATATSKADEPSRSSVTQGAVLRDATSSMVERSAPVVSGSDTNTANLSKSSTSSAASFTVEHVEAAAAASVASGAPIGDGDGGGDNNSNAPQPSSDRMAATAGFDCATKASSQSNTSALSTVPKPPAPPTVSLKTSSLQQQQPTTATSSTGASHATQLQPGKSIESTQLQSSVSTQPREKVAPPQPQPQPNRVIEQPQLQHSQANLSNQPQQRKAIIASQPTAVQATAPVQPQTQAGQVNPSIQPQGKVIVASQPQSAPGTAPAHPLTQPGQANLFSQPQQGNPSQPYVAVQALTPGQKPVSSQPPQGSVQPQPINGSASSQAQPRSASTPVQVQPIHQQHIQTQSGHAQPQPSQANLANQPQQGKAIIVPQPKMLPAQTHAPTQPGQKPTPSQPPSSNGSASAQASVGTPVQIQPIHIKTQPGSGQATVPAHPQPHASPANLSIQPQQGKAMLTGQPKAGHVIVPAQVHTPTQPGQKLVLSQPPQGSVQPPSSNGSASAQAPPRGASTSTPVQVQPNHQPHIQTQSGHAITPAQPQPAQANLNNQGKAIIAPQSQANIPVQPQPQPIQVNLASQQPNKAIVASQPKAGFVTVPAQPQPQPSQVNLSIQTQQGKAVVASQSKALHVPTAAQTQPGQKPMSSQPPQGNIQPQPSSASTPVQIQSIHEPHIQSQSSHMTAPAQPQPSQPQQGKAIAASQPPSAVPALPQPQPSQANLSIQPQQGKAVVAPQSQPVPVTAPANIHTPIQPQRGNNQPPSSYASVSAQAQPRSAATPVQIQQPHIQTPTSHAMTPAQPQPTQANVSNQSRQAFTTPQSQPQPQPQPPAHTGHPPPTTPQEKASSVRPVPPKTPVQDGKNSGLSAILAEYAMHAKQQQNAKNSCTPAVAVSPNNQTITGARSLPSVSTSTTSSAPSIVPPASLQLPSNASNHTVSSAALSTSNTSAQPANTTPAPVHSPIEAAGSHSKQAKLNHHPNYTESAPGPVADARANSQAFASDKSSTSGSVQAHHHHHHPYQQQQQQTSYQSSKPNPPNPNYYAPTNHIATSSASKQDSKSGNSISGSLPVSKSNSYSNQAPAVQVQVQGTPVSEAGRSLKANQNPSAAEMTPVQSQLNKSGSTTHSNSKSDQVNQQSTRNKSSPTDTRATTQPHHTQSQQNQVPSDITPSSNSNEYPPSQRMVDIQVASTPKSIGTVKGKSNQIICKNCGELHASRLCESLRCGACQVTFETVSIRREHYRKDHVRNQQSNAMVYTPIAESAAALPPPPPPRQSENRCDNCGGAHLAKYCDSLSCNFCDGTFATASLRRIHYRNVHAPQPPGSTKTSTEVPQSKADVDMNTTMAVVVASKSSAQQVMSSSSSAVVVMQETEVVPYNDQVFCQNCLERGHVSVDCSVMECGICFEVFTSIARRVAHSFLQHRDVVNAADYCQPISPRVQQLSDSEKSTAVVVSSGSSSRDNNHLSPSSSSSLVNGNKKRSRSPGDRDDRSYSTDPSSYKKLKGLDVSELEDILKVQREQMRQMREDMKAQRQQMESLQWDIEQHQQEMKQDKEGTHAQRQVMKQQQDMINRQQEESQQILKAFQEDADKITRRLLDVLHHRLGSSFAGR